MAEFKISLDEHRNKEYYTIINDSNELMYRWNEINNFIHHTHISSLRPWLFKKAARPFAKKMSALQEDYSKWHDMATRFQANPNLVIEINEMHHFIFLHYMSVLRTRIQQLNTDMKIIIDNFNLKYAESENKRNFLIALISLTFSLISFILAFIK